MTTIEITKHLKSNPSYLKKGDQWIANYFGCSIKTARTVKDSLSPIKRRYVNMLKKRQISQYN